MYLERYDEKLVAYMKEDEGEPEGLSVSISREEGTSIWSPHVNAVSVAFRERKLKNYLLKKIIGKRDILSSRSLTED